MQTCSRKVRLVGALRLQSLRRHRNQLLELAEALLYAEQNLAAHEQLIAAAFSGAVPLNGLRALAGRVLAWTTTRPQPTIRELAGKLRSDPAMRAILHKRSLVSPLIPVVPVMRSWPGFEALPRIETVGDLAAWFRVDVGCLGWMADQADRNRRQNASPLQHYSLHLLAKPGGAARLVEAPKQHLRHIQRQILREILDLVPQHHAVHGFRKGRSIVSFAEPHAGKRCVLRLDLKEFFPSISGPRVQAMFRTLGYPEHVADMLGALCTTTTPSAVWRHAVDLDAGEVQRLKVLYKRPHLPQGAPTSPAIANVCALRLDRRLAGLAEAAGAVYTRYADDLAFSGDAAFARSAERFSEHVAAIVLEQGFHVQHRKTRLMRASLRQHVAGLTVNVKPNLPRRELERLEAILTNCVRHGPHSQNREEHPDFRAHLEGKVAFVAMVRPERALRLRAVLRQIHWS